MVISEDRYCRVGGKGLEGRGADHKVSFTCKFDIADKQQDVSYRHLDIEV